jgi:CBS-domain-containing membrane protein
MKVEDVMCRRVLTCFPDDTLDRAAQIMWEEDCGCLPVVSDRGELVGIITDRDVCMAAYIRGVTLRGATVGSVMSQLVATCRLGEDVSQAERLMKAKVVRRIPVLNEAGAPVGIVTLGDLARAAEAHGQRGMLAAPQITLTLAAICEPRAHVEPAAA